MPYILDDLVVDRVDFVYEGANSAAFIEFFKRKETKEPMEYSEILEKLKPEHADVIKQHVEALNASLETANGELAKANSDLEAANNTISEQATTISETNDALAKANEELETLKSKDCTCDGEADDNGVCKTCGKAKKALSFDEEEVLKSIPEGLRTEFLKMRAQKEAAEEQVRKAAEEKREAEAVAKAASLKALPVSQEQLVQILKSCDANVAEVLTTVAAAIEGTVLEEVGKAGSGKASVDAWGKIEAEAEKIAERDSITKQKAIGVVIKERPDLYKDYLNGGNN